MTDIKVQAAEFPCVKIKGMLHVTASGSECLCGLRYSYAEAVGSEITATPILWRTTREIDCPRCKTLATEKENGDKEASAEKIMTIQERVSCLLLELRAIAEERSCNEEAFSQAVRMIDADLSLTKSAYMLAGHPSALVAGSEDLNPIGKDGARKKVCCVETGMIYDTIADAGKDTGINAGNIGSALRGALKSAGGYTWTYVSAAREENND